MNFPTVPRHVAWLSAVIACTGIVILIAAFGDARLATGCALALLAAVMILNRPMPNHDALSAAEERGRQTELSLIALRVELEGRVHERTLELEEANQELEAFSYSISHDLRSPLRAIDGFSRIVMTDYAPQLPPEARVYLEDVRTNAQRMGTLITDLLAFSRLSRQSLKKQSVDMTAVLMQCWKELASEREGRQVELKLGPLPEGLADPSLIKQVWMNLLSNALKYSRQTKYAVVEITCNGEALSGEYSVKDNGVGFDMKYAPKLFGVFQRLHRAEDFEGSGVGLAIVQRIIRRHGGVVRAIGEPGGGATFSFILSAERGSNHG